MKIQYFSDTDTLYLSFTLDPSFESEVINENLVIHFDQYDNLVGITIEHYSKVSTSQTIEMVINEIKQPQLLRQ
ncbi:DUF2283 domain-containing protein [Prochlorothrix hollandica]|uniref:DUF2283 domain-containing protein n=1 Tax=Prochlorothrix hollandica PCC 9006 = CALU 1027 TaxID=317619 RepID=A0A0M2PPK0_PROHO|nr:DUF2283 domain-containing protein [Prochlorothrix hollandica]KKI98189.1 hypothetical protein PROH_21165 [Prochlorothrix hollandica PCC 9006 = CALU 1027]